MLKTEAIDLGARIGVVAHDAGGAEVVSSFLWKTKIKFKALLGGPAVKIFKTKVGGVRVLSFDDLMNDIDILITGTSYPENLEWEAIKIAKKKNIEVITFLDSYINFRIRFIRQNQLLIPNKVFASDDHSFNIAKKDLPEFNVIKINNYHKEFVISSLKKINISNSQPQENKKILYVTEPTSKSALKIYGDKNYWGYTEFTALDFFINNLEKINTEMESLIIKPHPSEDSNKYSRYSQRFDFIEINKNNTLIDLISQSNVVVGCSSMALLVATWLGKRVFSSIPPDGSGFYLPKDDIMFIRDIIGVNSE